MKLQVSPVRFASVGMTNGGMGRDAIALRQFLFGGRWNRRSGGPSAVLTLFRSIEKRIKP